MNHHHDEIPGRVHRHNMNQQRAGWSDEQRRSWRCAQSKARTAERKQKLREEAAVRQKAYNALSVEDRLARLDASGFIAARERCRLHSRLAASTVSNAVNS